MLSLFYMLYMKFVNNFELSIIDYNSECNSCSLIPLHKLLRVVRPPTSMYTWLKFITITIELLVSDTFF